MAKRNGKKDGRGGYRPGSGRKKGAGVATYSIRINPAQAELLKIWGGGDISAGLRWLINISELYIRSIKHV